MTATTSTIHGYSAAVTADPINDFLLIDPASTGNYLKISRNILLGFTGTPMDTSTAQSVSNKALGNTNALTIKDGSLTLQNTSDVTKQAIFSLAGITTGTSRTLTLPNRSDTLATLGGTETLTAKTLTAPTINGGTIDNTTVTVDSISGHTISTIVTVGGVQLNNGVVGTVGAVTTNSIAAGAVVPNSLVASTGSGWSWTTWAPTWTNLSVGNGVLTAKYAQIGKTILFRLYLVFGSTTSVSGSVSLTAPATAASAGGSRLIAGWVRGEDTGVASYPGGAIELTSTTLLTPLFINVAGTYPVFVATAAATPFTWGNGDELVLSGFYEAA